MYRYQYRVLNRYCAHDTTVSLIPFHSNVTLTSGRYLEEHQCQQFGDILEYAMMTKVKQDELPHSLTTHQWTGI